MKASGKFPSRIRELRQRFGMTQAELAKRVRVTQQAVVLWEHGRAVPQGDSVKRHAKIFSVPADDLLGFDKGRYVNLEKRVERLEKIVDDRVKTQAMADELGVSKRMVLKYIKELVSVGLHFEGPTKKGRRKAEYGKKTLEALSARLMLEYGNGYTLTNLKYMRQFYLAFPIGHALRDELGWTFFVRKGMGWGF